MADNAVHVTLEKGTVVDLSTTQAWTVGEGYTFYVRAGREVFFTEELTTNVAPDINHSAAVSVKETQVSPLLKVASSTNFYAWTTDDKALIVLLRSL